MKYDRELLKTVHGSHEGIDKQVYTNKVIPFEDLKTIGRRFMGAGMSQSYSAIYWQEYFVESNRFDAPDVAVLDELMLCLYISNTVPFDQFLLGIANCISDDVIFFAANIESHA